MNAGGRRAAAFERLLCGWVARSDEVVQQVRGREGEISEVPPTTHKLLEKVSIVEASINAEDCADMKKLNRFS